MQRIGSRNNVPKRRLQGSQGGEQEELSGEGSGKGIGLQGSKYVKEKSEREKKRKEKYVHDCQRSKLTNEGRDASCQIKGGSRSKETKRI